MASFIPAMACGGSDRETVAVAWREPPSFGALTKWTLGTQSGFLRHNASLPNDVLTT